jgi:hypothetical protein
MNYSMIKVLMFKDWYLQRWTVAASLLGGVIALGIICIPGKVTFMLGLILVITVLIAVGAQLAIATMVNERKEQTLPFVMSLPISFREYTAAKILGTLLIFLIPWLALVLGSLALFALPHGVPHGLLPFTAIMSVEILVSTCLLVAVALVTESQGWSVAAIMFGNIAFDIFGFIVAHIAGIAEGMSGTTVSWSPAASIVLLSEFAAIALLLGLTFFFQSRKVDFV